MSAEQKTAVFLVDDHPMVRAGLAQLLQSSGFTVTGEAGSGPEALAHPALSERPLVIVDLSLGEDSGIELIRRLGRLGIAVLVYSMHEGAQTIRHALEAGAHGYATKRDAAESLIEAVYAVHAGSRYLSPRAHAALQRASPVDAMSDRQREIYLLMGRGCPNEEIARHLGISVRTLESYCVRMMDKLGVQGTKELRQLAIREAANDGGV